jgi:hypothetical protein
MSDIVVAELTLPQPAVEAARRAYALGYRKIEAYTPFVIPELDDVLAIRRTRSPWLVLGGGLTGIAAALGIQWWTNAVDYPLDVGGRPRFSLPTDVPIVFEIAILFAAFAAFFAVLFGSRLPRLHDPMFDVPGFERTSVDRFWIVISDAFAFEGDDIIELREALEGAGAVVTCHPLGGR